MEYVLERSVKMQHHIELPKNKDLLSNLTLNSENIHPDIFNHKEVISMIAKNGVYMEINLIGTLILDMIIKDKNINEITSEISNLFNEKEKIIENDVLLFLEDLVNKGYLVKLCLN
ncbi:PqqD family protein [Enterococcus sp. CWB-B31]|uniref:PqqD family protein n=1 Tax=Enterococcus sp. CWB-B31 TaxID=2885159 RepID=UPI001E3A90A7|nr:PqqD family protein [Enterococcus sp. CWB-B31]MCB5954401.1 PqqD family protein [Enterococcus sp. CWB-B31]